MRPLTALLGSLTIPFLLLACSDDQPLATAPAVTPALALSPGKAVALDPSHTYRFDFTCSSAAPNSLVTITTATNIPRISVTCNSWTEMGAVNGTFFNEFGYEIGLDSPGGKVCSAAGLTTTGTFKCRSHKYVASVAVTDEGVVTQ